ncbi:glycosyltransferase family 4 protein [Phaeocystidibacter luteus]|uniref:Glycosyltransferase family 4 protein n=1 Tax=Phaeocystidibacter luteus TaxID=911197 RepID=A0A6N6RL22_9FLAO|nr:glycosyltransferase family 4 protein [Phaeocystidibacter luteus]KAB2814347.1 glycosyltransferase family 4 protein [Phaeocystidibacter luteus]
MKLMLVINNEFSAFHLRGAVRHFSEKGWDVLILSTPGPLVDKLAEEEGGRVVPIQLAREINPFADLQSLFQLLRILKREKPDVINVGSPKTGFLFALAKILRPKLPVIFTLRGIRSDTLTGLKKRVVKFTERLSCTMADEVIVISPSLREHAVSVGILKQSKAHVLGSGSSNGVDTHSFKLDEHNQKQGDELRAKFGIHQNDFVLSTVGRVTKDKGIEEVYRAVTTIDDPRLHWLVAGPAEESDPIDADILSAMKINPRIHFLGQMDPIQPVFAASDLHVLYSYREGFGNVVLQASAMGKPVVVADIPGLRDTTADNLSGRVIEGRNPQALSAAIRSYMESPELCERHGTSGLKRVKEQFAQEVIWKGQEELYHKVSGK